MIEKASRPNSTTHPQSNNQSATYPIKLKTPLQSPISNLQSPISNLHSPQQPPPIRLPNRRRPVRYIQLLENVGQMRLDRRLADEEPFCYFAVCRAVGHQVQYFNFARA